MSCPAPSLLAVYADGGLEGTDALAIERHLAECAQCRALADGFAAEAALLRRALRHEEPVPIPPLSRPLGPLAWLLLALGGGAVGASALAVWAAVARAVPAALRWLDPLEPGGLFDLSVTVLIRLAIGGTAMIDSAVSSAVSALVLVAAAVAAFLLLRRRAGAAAFACTAVLAAALPTRGDAVEIRRGMPIVTVPAGETVADTLIVMAESVAVDGDVQGDLIAFARRVTVRGHVTGSVLGAAETVTIEGTVDGNALAFARAVTLSRARVERNFYGFGRDVTIGTSAEVVGNALAFGETVGMHGRVGIDLLSFAGTVEVGGEVARDVEAHGREVTLLPAARIGGDVLAHVPDEDDVRASSGSRIGGEVATAAPPEAPRNKYLTPGFYAGQALRLGALFLAGLVLLWLFAGLREVTLHDGRDALAAAGRGLVAAIVLPVVSVLLLITIFGIPLGVLGFLLWGLGLYLAKVPVAHIIGRRLFASPAGPPHYATTLIAGLVLVVMAINVPLVGWVVNAAVTLVGLGLLTRYALGHVGPRAAQSTMA
ncbi:MAG TPA: zf-HC2 domain-containing protein [Gammaproteobacteria bacterium]